MHNWLHRPSPKANENAQDSSETLWTSATDQSTVQAREGSLSVSWAVKVCHSPVL